MLNPENENTLPLPPTPLGESMGESLSSKSGLQVVGIVCESRKNTSPYPFG